MEKKIHGKWIRTKFFPTKSCFKMGKKCILIFRIKVCMLPYHIALDVVATNLYIMFLIDNNFIFLWLLF